jgi:hypothetical protein
MSLRFNGLLSGNGIDLTQVRLLRHQTTLPNGLTPFDLFDRDRPSFEKYQSYQPQVRRSYFKGRYWATFVGLSDGSTLFSGLYHVGWPEPVEEPYIFGPTGQQFGGGVDDLYPLRLANELSNYIGLLYIDWGGGPSGKRAWVQRADGQDKPIVGLYPKDGPAQFPGLGAFIKSLSELAGLPPTWTQELARAKGVYLLTCPRTGEHYVGSARGSDGFLGRWREYVADGHGGNLILKAREPSDYQVSILEVAGQFDSDEAILELEQRWKQKLQPRLCGN